MKRSAFARKPFVSTARVKVWTGKMPTPRAAAVRVVDHSARLVVPLRKDCAVEHEGYRKLVASLPCSFCRVEGYSQCAHPNTGKAKGAKADDRLCFPLCCARPGVPGCHFMFDQHKLFARQHRETVENVWGGLTRQKLADQWPARLPRWENV